MYSYRQRQQQQQQLFYKLNKLILVVFLSFVCCQQQQQHGHQCSSLLLRVPFKVRTTTTTTVSSHATSFEWFKNIKKDPTATTTAAATSVSDKQRILTTLTGLRAGAGYNAATGATGDLLGDSDDDNNNEHDEEDDDEDYSLPPRRPFIQYSSALHPSQQQQQQQQQEESLMTPPPPQQQQSQQQNPSKSSTVRRALIIMDAFCDYHGLYLADHILHNPDDTETAVIFVLSDYLRGYLLKTQSERTRTWQAMRMPRRSTTSITSNDTDEGNSQPVDTEDDDDASLLLLQEWKLGLEIVGVYCESDSGLHNAEELRLLLNVTHYDDPIILSARRDKFLKNERIASMTSLPVVRQQLCTTLQQARDFCIQELGMSSSSSSSSSCRRVVVKPCRGVASEDVKLCQSIPQVETAFHAILGTPIFGSSGRHEAVLIQEYLIGCEYAVDGVCRNGHYKVAAVWRYDKRPNIKKNNSDNNGTTILADFCYFKTELVDATMDPNVNAVCTYVKQVLHALGIRQGLSHTEVIVTDDGRGPVLVEVNCRQHNMDFIPLTMICIGYNALDMTLTALLGSQEEWDSFPDMAILQRDDDTDYGSDADRCRHGCMVHLVNSNTGILKRVQYMEEMSKLPSFVNGQVYPHFLEIGNKISPTIDIKSDAGWIQLVHEDIQQLNKDYQQILDWMPTMFEVVDES